jgi:hypothetical protein
MAKRQTAKIANSDLFNGDKLYLKTAKKALPYLVRQAKVGQTIYYSDLAQELDVPNPRNLNYVLGAIGNALIELTERTKIEIPAIQCIVVNKKEELPGEGIVWFISKTDFSKLNRTQKQKVVAAQLTQISAFQKWDWVLAELGLEQLKPNFDKVINAAKAKRGSSGESEQHKKFKDFISKNPSAVGLKPNLDNGLQEYKLISADTIDVLFTDKDLQIAIEVKSLISDTSDILRGLFQCVKYKHLLEAEQAINNIIPNCKVILALEGQLPNDLKLIKNILGIKVVENAKNCHQH